MTNAISHAPTMLRVAVTGGNGFIGRHLVRWLDRNQVTVSAPDSDGVNLQIPNQIVEWLQDASPQVVFHLAATGVTHARANDESVVDENLRMIAHVVDACPEGTKLIVAGSMSEYGGQGIHNETDVCAPSTMYGRAKLAVTNYAMQFGPRRGLAVCVARLFGVYGEGEASGRLFPSLMAQLTARQPVALSDGLQERDFIHVEDVCEGLWRLCQATHRETAMICNLGTGVSVRVRDVALWMADSLQADRRLLQFGAKPRSPGDVDLIAADTTLLRRTTAWTPPQRLQPTADFTRLLQN